MRNITKTACLLSVMMTGCSEYNTPEKPRDSVELDGSAVRNATTERALRVIRPTECECQLEVRRVAVRRETTRQQALPVINPNCTPPLAPIHQRQNCIGDLDCDGLSNRNELRHGTSQNDPDTDNDGLIDSQEVELIPFNNDLHIRSNPLSIDTDSDGVCDYFEHEYTAFTPTLCRQSRWDNSFLVGNCAIGLLKHLIDIHGLEYANTHYSTLCQAMPAIQNLDSNCDGVVYNSSRTSLLIQDGIYDSNTGFLNTETNPDVDGDGFINGIELLSGQNRLWP